MSSVLRKMCGIESEHDWFMWEQGASVLSLSSTCDVLDRNMEPSIPENQLPVFTPPVLNRPQYSAIISRMNSAASHAGTYSSL